MEANLQLSSQTKQTLKYVSIGVAMFGIGFLFKKLYQKYSLRKTLHNQQINKFQSPLTQRLNTQRSQYSQYYFDKDQQIQYIESLMPECPSVQDIYLNSPLIARDQFVKYTKQIRKRRRLIRKINEDQYINTILTYQNQVQQLLIRSRLQLIQALNIDPDDFANLQQNYETIEDLRALHKKSQQMLRNKLITDTNQKRISNEKLKQILQQETCFIQSKMYERLRSKLQKETSISHSQILTVIYALLQDIIYDKFGYEMEDIARKIQEIRYDTRERNQLRKKMQVQIGQFNYDSLESNQDPQDALQIYGASKLNESTKALQSSQAESNAEKQQKNNF